MGKKQVAKRKRRKAAVIRVQCDGMLYETEEGEEVALRAGQWVEFRAKMTARDIVDIASFSQMGEFDDGDDIAEVAPIYERMVKFLAHKIVRWNWLDIDGDYDPLPPPTFETLLDLDNDDLIELLGLYNGMTEPDPKAS